MTPHFPKSLALVLCLACSQSPQTPEVTGDPSSVMMPIGPSGGVISVGSESTNRIELTIPPQALRATQEIVLRRIDPVGDALASFAVEPADLQLDAPISVAWFGDEFVGSADLSIAIGTAGSRIYPATAREGNRLSASIARLTSVRVDGARAAGEPGGLHVVESPCDVRLRAGQDTFAFLVDRNEIGLAIEVVMNMSGLLAEDECQPGISEWLEEAGDAVCTAQAAAIEVAALTVTDDYHVLGEVLRPIVHWSAIGALLGRSCNSGQDAIGSEIAEFLTFYSPEAAALGPTDFERFRNLYDEAVDLITLMGQSALLGSDSGEQIRSQALYPVLELLREHAYRVVQNGGDTYFLARLTSAGLFLPRRIIETGPRASRFADFPYTDDEIFADIQYAATQVQVQSKGADGTLLITANVGGGAEPGSIVDAATLLIDPDGTVELGNTLRSLTCWLTGPSSDELVIRFAGQETHRFPSDGAEDFLSSNVVLPLSALSGRSGATLTPGTTVELQIRRERRACDTCDCSVALLGPEATTLVSLSCVVGTKSEDDRITGSALGGTVVGRDAAAISDQYNVTYPDELEFNSSQSGTTASASSSISVGANGTVTITVTAEVLARAESLASVDIGLSFELSQPMSYQLTVEDSIVSDIHGHAAFLRIRGSGYDLRRRYLDGVVGTDETGSTSSVIDEHGFGKVSISLNAPTYKMTSGTQHHLSATATFVLTPL